MHLTETKNTGNVLGVVMQPSFTQDDAARAAGVPVNTLRSWQRRGHVRTGEILSFEDVFVLAVLRSLTAAGVAAWFAAQAAAASRAYLDLPSPVWLVVDRANYRAVGSEPDLAEALFDLGSAAAAVVSLHQTAAEVRARLREASRAA